MNENKLIVDNLTFKCALCAECCRHWNGTIYISIFEVNNIANVLNYSLEEVLKKFIHIEEEIYELNGQVINLTYLAVNQPNNQCIFLSEDNKCTIHDYKPFLCKIYPFWSILMQDKSKFEEYSKICKGLNNKEGNFYNSNQILEFLKGENEYLENLNRIAIIMNSIDEDEIIKNILDQMDPDMIIDKEALIYLKNNLILEKIRILINSNS